MTGTTMTTPDWELIGPIIRTQIHTDRMVDDGNYDASKIVEVDEISLSPDGLVGHVGDTALLHGHHRQHPNKMRKRRPRTFLEGRLLSIGFTSHYTVMAEFFGNAPIGCAAEDLIVSCAHRVTVHDLGAGIQIRRGSELIAELSGASPAQPCVPFITYLLGADATPDRIDEGREVLRDGTRGFRFGTPSPSPKVRVATRDTLWRRSGIDDR